MAKAYYSTVLDQSADRVWSVIRSFDHYGWAGVPGETVIEGGRAGDQVGSVRRFQGSSGALRQILLAHSDIERSYSYAFVGDPPMPAHDYLATIRVSPVIETGQSFVEWWATFDAATEERDRLIEHFQTQGFAVWLNALRAHMTRC